LYFNKPINELFKSETSSSCSEGNVFSEFSHLGVEESNKIRNGLSIRVSVKSSLLVIIGSLIAFSSAVISLGGLIFSSLISIVLGGLGGSNSVIEGGDFSFKVGNLAVVLVDILLEKGNIFVEGTNSVVFGLSFKVESLAHLVLKIVNKLNNTASKLLISNLAGSAGQLSEHLDGLTVVGGVDEVVEFAWFSGKVSSNLGEDLGDVLNSTS